MERGIYFDGWYKHEHCYHPSLPMRSMQMLEDLEDYHATVLVWAGMGGGSISLPYLQHEAFGEVDPRMQIYGYMNDSDFVAECNKRNIKLFGIVFEVQGWEYPAVFNEEGKLLRMNLRAEDAENPDWYGLREFSMDKHSRAFSTSLKDYYPEGIKDKDGNPVTDLWEECCIRDRFGAPVHAQWVEVKGRREQCYQMCRNNPVWRDYLKKIIEIQIDVGVPGIQLDECELPMTAINSGGCFCKSCRKQFTAYLKEKKGAGELGSPRTPSKGAAVLYSYGSYYWRDSNKGSGANGMQDAYGSLLDATASEWLDPDLKPVPFWDIIRALSDKNVQYDSVMMPDGILREDDFNPDLIKDYPLLVIPDCYSITENQRRILLDYAEKGGSILIAGRIAEGSTLREELEKTGNAVFVELVGNKEEYMPRFMEVFDGLYADIAPVLCGTKNVGIQRYDKDGAVYVHVLNYRYDEAADCVKPVDEMELVLRDVADNVTILTPEGVAKAEASVKKEGALSRIVLRNVGLYTVVCIK